MLRVARERSGAGMMRSADAVAVRKEHTHAPRTKHVYNTTVWKRNTLRTTEERPACTTTCMPFAFYGYALIPRTVRGADPPAHHTQAQRTCGV